MKKTLLTLFALIPAIVSAQLNNDYPQLGTVRISDYSPTLVLQRNTNEGGFTQGIQTRFLDGTNNWFFGNLHQDNWIVSKGDYQDVKFSIQSNGNVGIGTTNTPFKLEVNGSFKSGRGSFVNNAHSAGANDFNLELYSNNTGDPLKYVSLRFHQGDQFWAQIRYNGYGFRLTQGASDDLNNLTLANLFAMQKIGIGTTTPQMNLHINNGPNSDAAILATSSEDNKLVVSSGSTQPVNCETFRIAQQFNEDRNNGFIGFNRGNGTNGGFLTFGTNGVERIRIDTDGNVGIGTASPGANSKLQIVGGGLGIGSSPSPVDASLHITSSFGGADRLLQMSPTGASKPALNLIASTNSTSSYQWWVWGVTLDNIWRIQDGTSFNGDEGFSINSSGNVGIGTTSLSTYKLNVSGKIRADEIVVNTTGADFVFDPEYTLPDLAEIENYIKENKHLPNIQPASDMQEDGMNMSEMQTKLLQKVEELTLYIIELNKKIENLEAKKNN